MIDQKTFLKLLPRIKKCFLFSKLEQSDRTWALIQEKARFVCFDKGEWIVARELGLVISGQVQVLSGDPSSPRTILLNVIEPPGIFRAATIFEAETSEQTMIRAGKKAKVILFPPGLLLEIFVDKPMLLQNYLSFLANRIHFLNRKIQTLTAGRAEERLLLFLADYGHQVQQDTFVLPMQANQLAAALNMSRATLYRAIEALTALDIIQYQDKQIIIKDAQVIKNMLKEEAMRNDYIS